MKKQDIIIRLEAIYEQKPTSRLVALEVLITDLRHQHHIGVMDVWKMLNPMLDERRLYDRILDKNLLKGGRV